jgi:hypothetical protein
MNPQAAIALLKRESIANLGGFDGCYCCNFMVQGFYVDIGCWKGSESMAFYGMTVRVYSHYLYVGPDDLCPVAQEVARQVHEMTKWHHLRVRYCDYTDDKECKCNYCGKKRAAEGYLCDKCLHENDVFGEPIAPRRDYTKIEFRLDAEPEEP